MYALLRQFGYVDLDDESEELFEMTPEDAKDLFAGVDEDAFIQTAESDDKPDSAVHTEEILVVSWVHNRIRLVPVLAYRGINECFAWVEMEEFIEKTC